MGCEDSKLLSISFILIVVLLNFNLLLLVAFKGTLQFHVMLDMNIIKCRRNVSALAIKKCLVVVIPF